MCIFCTSVFPEQKQRQNYQEFEKTPLACQHVDFWFLESRKSLFFFEKNGPEVTPPRHPPIRKRSKNDLIKKGPLECQHVDFFTFFDKKNRKKKCARK